MVLAVMGQVTMMIQVRTFEGFHQELSSNNDVVIQVFRK